MKLFADETGKFQMFIPINWEYKNPSFYKNTTAPESFGEYTKMAGAFQVSCKVVTNHISKLISENNLKIHTYNDVELHFDEKVVRQKDLISYMWMAAVEDHFILATYSVTPIKKAYFFKYKKELKSVRKALSSIKFVKPEHRDIVVSQKRLSLFMASIATTIQLRNNSIKHKSFIEFIALSANHVDALLRLSIIYNDQIVNNNKEIDTALLFQKESDKPIMEKDIYKKALEKNIITQELYEKLFSLYNERNKVIHRYIITDIRTEDLLEIAVEYDKIDHKIDDLVNNLEHKQFELKVGIFGTDSPPNGRLNGLELKKLQYQIRDKHGKIKISNSTNRLRYIYKSIVNNLRKN